MSEKVKKIRVKQKDGSMSDYIPLGADASNIDMQNGLDAETIIGKKPYYFNSVAAMKAAEYLKEGDYAITLGYYEANDGGAGDYTIVSGEYTDDGGSIHALSNGLYAELIIKNNQINIKQFGAKGEKTQDALSFFKKAINFVTQTKGRNPFLNFTDSSIKTIFIPNGYYFFSNTLEIQDSNENGGFLQGESKWNTFIQFEVGGISFGTAAKRWRFKNFSITSKDIDATLLNASFSSNVSNTYDFHCENISFYGTKNLCKVLGNAYTWFENCDFNCGSISSLTNYGLYATGEYLYLNKCTFAGNDNYDAIGLYITDNSQIFIDQCDFPGFRHGKAIYIEKSFNIYVSNTSFMRNEYSFYLDSTIGPVIDFHVDNCFFFDDGDSNYVEQKILRVGRDASADAIIANVTISDNCRIYGILKKHSYFVGTLTSPDFKIGYYAWGSDINNILYDKSFQGIIHPKISSFIQKPIIFTNEQKEYLFKWDYTKELFYNLECWYPQIESFSCDSDPNVEKNKDKIHFSIVEQANDDFLYLKCTLDDNYELSGWKRFFIKIK